MKLDAPPMQVAVNLLDIIQSGTGEADLACPAPSLIFQPGPLMGLYGRDAGGEVELGPTCLIEPRDNLVHEGIWLPGVSA